MSQHLKSGIGENMKQLLSQLVTDSGSSKSSKLWSLNCFAKLCYNMSADTSAKELPFDPKEVFCW